jgi:hypothetical protein
MEDPEPTPRVSPEIVTAQAPSPVGAAVAVTPLLEDEAAPYKFAKATPLSAPGMPVTTNAKTLIIAIATTRCFFVKLISLTPLNIAMFADQPCYTRDTYD